MVIDDYTEQQQTTRQEYEMPCWEKAILTSAHQEQHGIAHVALGSTLTCPGNIENISHRTDLIHRF